MTRIKIVLSMHRSSTVTGFQKIESYQVQGITQADAGSVGAVICGTIICLTAATIAE
jgi:hypothetical protein